MFYTLEDGGVLDVENELHLVALRYVYVPRINQTLSSFGVAWNNHGLSTSNNRTPVQLWSTSVGRHNYTAVQEIFAPSENDHDSDTSSSSLSSGIEVRASSNQYSNLTSIDPLAHSNVWGVEIYAEAVRTLLKQ